MKDKTLLLLLSSLFLFFACARPPEATPTPEPTPTPDPAAILRRAGETMQALSSARFEITRTGGPVYVDPNGQLLFNSAVGQYAAPDSIQVLIRAQGFGLNVEVNSIAIGQDQWLTNPLTQQWEQLPPGWGFNPAVLFDPALGWEPLLTEDVSNMSPLREVDLNGRNVYYVEATIAGERVRVITAGLAGDEAVDLKIWIDPATFHVLQLQLDTEGPAGEPSNWTLTFSDFNAPVTIEPPVQ